MAGSGGQIKGAGFARSWEHLHALAERGAVSEEALRVELSPAAYSLYQEKVQPSLWYPLAAVNELSQQIIKIEGEGDPAYNRTLGAEALGVILARDSYRGLIEGAMKQKGSEGQTLVQLASLVYDFGQWTFEGEDLSKFEAIMTEAEPLPELATFSIAGFMETLVAHCTGNRIAVTIDRPSLDKVIFRAAPAG